MTTRTSGFNPFAMFAVFVILLGMLAVAATENPTATMEYGFSEQSVVLPSTPADAPTGYYFAHRVVR